MPFNVNNFCKVIHVGKKNVNMDYTLMGLMIPKAKEEKDLGVFFLDKFKPSYNCNKASKAASKVVGLIRRNIVHKGSEGMLVLYKTLVRPILDYCIQVWRPYTIKDINAIERIQKRYTKKSY